MGKQSPSHQHVIIIAAQLTLGWISVWDKNSPEKNISHLKLGVVACAYNPSTSHLLVKQRGRPPLMPFILMNEVCICDLFIWTIAFLDYLCCPLVVLTYNNM